MADWGLSGDGQKISLYGATIISSSTVGTAATTPASANTYGVWAQLTVDSTGTPITHANDGQALLLTVWQGISAAEYLLDIGVGASASTVQTIIEKLYFNSSGSTMRGQQIYLPLETQAGQVLWARISSNLASAATMTLAYSQISFGFRPPRTYQKCVTYNMPGTVLNPVVNVGATNSTAIPIAFSDPGATVTSTKVFANITTVASPATTTIQYPVSMAMFAFVPGNPGASQATEKWYVDIRRSTGSSIIIPDIVVSQEANSDRISQGYFGPVPLSIPAGETIQAGVCVNAASATVTIRELGVIMYCFS